MAINFHQSKVVTGHVSAVLALAIFSSAAHGFDGRSAGAEQKADKQSLSLTVKLAKTIRENAFNLVTGEGLVGNKDLDGEKITKTCQAVAPKISLADCLKFKLKADLDLLGDLDKGVALIDYYIDHPALEKIWARKSPLVVKESAKILLGASERMSQQADQLMASNTHYAIKAGEAFDYEESGVLLSKREQATLSNLSNALLNNKALLANQMLDSLIELQEKNNFSSHELGSIFKGVPGYEAHWDHVPVDQRFDSIRAVLRGPDQSPSSLVKAPSILEGLTERFKLSSKPTSP